MPLNYREYGTGGHTVIALHGGPAAAGSIAPVARELSAEYHVLEPWQRGSGDGPLTVPRHVEDLREFAADHCAGQPPVLVGESWGAMLALAFAAAHPHLPSGVVLIGCGTFDLAARNRLHETLEARKTPAMREQLQRIASDSASGQQLARLHEAALRLYEYDPMPAEPDPAVPAFDAQAHEATWQDMLRQQASGLYPGAFARITCPVTMIHGDFDPHPGPAIRDGLLKFMPQLQYHGLLRCGHTPWLERQAREQFYKVLRKALAQMLSNTPPAGCGAPQ